MKINEDQFFDIAAEAASLLFKNLKAAYREDRLDDLLRKYGMEGLIPRNQFGYDTNWDGKLLIIGDSRISSDIIYGITKNIGLNPEQVEVFLEYDLIEKYNFKNLQYNPTYRLVLCGPMPHSNTSTGDYSNPISMMEQEEGFPRVIRLGGTQDLKITKSNLKITIKEQIANGYLQIQ